MWSVWHIVFINVHKKYAFFVWSLQHIGVSHVCESSSNLFWVQIYICSGRHSIFIVCVVAILTERARWTTKEERMLTENWSLSSGKLPTPAEMDQLAKMLGRSRMNIRSKAQYMLKKKRAWLTIILWNYYMYHFLIVFFINYCVT